MEIWFIGGAVVALMVYVSTRIKKSASAAFDRETIETEGYSFIKPEGFICPVGKITSGTCFVHSRNFGEFESTETLYQAEAVLVTQQKSFESLKSEAVSAGQYTIEDLGSRGFILRGPVTENGVELKLFRKVLPSADGIVLDFSVRVLCDNLNEFEAKAEEMVISFTDK